MDKSSEQPKKCFCARCFLPIDPEDKIDIEGQNFHKQCCTCCICRSIPTSLKMFYGHVFCNECFKTYVMSRFKGDIPPQMNNCWAEWGPGNPMKADTSEGQDKEEKSEEKDKEKSENEKTDCKKEAEEPHPKKCICARCLQAVDDSEKIDIGGQSFHKHCAKCCVCHCIPKDNVKIYYGQVFCEECFQRHVLNKSKDSSPDFFNNCFEQWQNPKFAEQMKDFMASGGNMPCPLVFMLQQSGPEPMFCKCGNCPQPEWFMNEPRKCA